MAGLNEQFFLLTEYTTIWFKNHNIENSGTVGYRKQQFETGVVYCKAISRPERSWIDQYHADVQLFFPHSKP